MQSECADSERGLNDSFELFDASRSIDPDFNESEVEVSEPDFNAISSIRICATCVVQIIYSIGEYRSKNTIEIAHD